MESSRKRKLARMHSSMVDTLSPRAYNLAIGALILYGFVANAILVLVAGKFFMGINPMIFIVGYIVCCLAGTFMAIGSNKPAISFIGYTLVVVPIGAVLSISLPFYKTADILSAVVVTGAVVAIMMGLSTVYPRVFAKMGRTLVIALLVGVIGEFIAILFGYGGDIFNWLFVVLFSLYIGYDWQKAQMYPKTLDNAIDSALDLYLDIINLFIRLLQIFGRSDD